jgi:hypothetical protein
VYTTVNKRRLPCLPRTVEVERAIMIAVGLVDRVSETLMPVQDGALRKRPDSAIVEPPLHRGGHMLYLDERSKPRIGDDGKVRKVSV